MNPLDYYVQQSRFTDPGKFSYLFAGLPHDLGDLCQVVDGIYIHYMSETTIHYPVPADRKPEINLLHMERMLARIVELDDRPLTIARPMDKRLVGCCRDGATLLCAMLRHQGVPARVRVGFANYFTTYDPGLSCNHEVAEVWDRGQQRWRLVDPDLNERAMQDCQVPFSPLDVPRDRFQVGGLAWQLCRKGAIDPSRYSVGTGSGIAGAGLIRGCLLQDLAALNKLELLCWDCWGWMLQDMATHTEAELSLLDQAARLTQGGNDDFAAMQQAYETHPALHVPEKITRFDPLGPPLEVCLNG
jgi:hypothetical protein